MKRPRLGSRAGGGDAELGVRAGRAVVCRADRHGPAARAGRWQRPLEIREAVGTAPGTRRPRTSSALVHGAAERHLVALRSAAWTQARGREGWSSMRSPAERRSRSTSSGFGRRAATRLSTLFRKRPWSHRSRLPSAGYVQSIATTAIGQAALGLGAGRLRRRTTSTTPWESSVSRSADRRPRPAMSSPRCTLAPTNPPRPGSRGRRPPTRIGPEPPRDVLDRARRHRLTGAPAKARA